VSVAYPSNNTAAFTVQLNMDIRIHWIRLAGLNTSGDALSVISAANNTRIFNVGLRTGMNGGCQNIGNAIYYRFWQPVHSYRAPVQRPKPFTFTVNCPEGYNSIRYWVGSPFRVASDPDGVVRLDPASAASGFAVRIWDGPGASAQPVKFGADNTYAVPGYVVYKGLWLDPGQPTGDDRAAASANLLYNRSSQPRQDYPITLKAALYQTEPTVTPGTFKTHILIYMVYK